MRLPFARSAAISLALCAMVLRALLPDGWMPNTVAGGAPFIMCSIDGAHHDGKSPPSREQSHAPCAFAAAAPLAPPHAVVPGAPARLQASTIAPLFGDALPAVTAPHRPGAARAPPAFS
jgi:hypothetical protein